MTVTAEILTAVSAPPRLLTAIGTASELIRPGRNQPSAELFRYGGWYYSGGGWTDSKANLYIANSSASISDSILNTPGFTERS